MDLFPIVRDPQGGYWITPPEIYDPLNKKYLFDHDPCPFPATTDIDGLRDPWGQSNYVNPPFWKGGGKNDFCRRAVSEAAQGRGSVIVVPVYQSTGILLQGGARFLFMDRVKWIHTQTGERTPDPGPVAFFEIGYNQNP